MSFELRQNPLDKCILEQSLNGGDTWQTVFDYSLCADENNKKLTQSLNFSQSLSNFTNIYNNYVTNYDGTLESIGAGDLVFGDSDDALRDDALCAALVAYVDKLCETALQIMGDLYEDMSTAATIVAGLLGLVLGVVAVAASGGLALPAVVTAGAAFATATGAAAGAAIGIGLSSIISGLVIDYLSSQSEATFQDQAARDEVICYMLDKAKAGTLTYANFQTLHSGFSGSANGTGIAGFVEILAIDTFYAAFLENWKYYLALARLDVPLPCPCSDSSWCFTNFSDLGSRSGYQANWNAFNPQVGVINDEKIIGVTIGNNQYLQVGYDLRTYQHGLTQMTFKFNFKSGNALPAGRLFKVELLDDGVRTQLFNNLYWFTNNTTATNTFDFKLSYNGYNGIPFNSVRIYANVRAISGGYLELVSAAFIGDGVNPDPLAPECI